MKKAILVMAASVAFLVSGLANAGTVTSLKDYKGTSAAPPIKQGNPWLKTKSGNVVPIKAKLGSPLGWALAIGGAVASTYFEDELNKSMYQLFLDTPTAPDGGLIFEDDGSWADGVYWVALYPINGVYYKGPTKTTACANFSAAAGSPYTRYLNTYCRNPQGYQTEVTQQNCSVGTDPSAGCGSIPQPTYDDGIPFYIAAPGAAIQPSGETDINVGGFPQGQWLEVEPEADQVRQRVKTEVLPNGNTRITTQTEYLDENGNLRTMTEVVELNPEGEIVSKSSADTEGGLDSQAAEDAATGPQDVNVLNKDLAQEATLQEIKEALTEVPEPDETLNDPIKVIGDDVVLDIATTEGVLSPNPINLPGFDGGGGCQSIPYNISGGAFSISGSLDKHCYYIDGYIRPFLTYLFAFLVLLYGWNRFNDVAGQGVN